MTFFSIRPVRVGDEETVVALLRALAEYEDLLHRFHVTADSVRRDYLCDKPAIFCDVLFEGEKPAGLATWYWTYGSFAAAKKIFLADLFVDPQFRGKHYGRALIGHLAKRVRDAGGVGMDWDVLDWNKPSIDFYDSLGARPVKGWIAYNLSGDALQKVADQ